MREGVNVIAKAGDRAAQQQAAINTPPDHDLTQENRASTLRTPES
jgi:hypothetical protein